MNIDKKATIVDVRTLEEFAAEHYPGAVNIPLDEVVPRIDEFKKMASPIITYCRRGNRSAIAVLMLKQNGIPYAVNGGKLEDLQQSQKL